MAHPWGINLYQMPTTARQAHCILFSCSLSSGPASFLRIEKIAAKWNEMCKNCARTTKETTDPGNEDVDRMPASKCKPWGQSLETR